MSHYFHHVPGRIRIRSRRLRSNVAHAQALVAHLLETEGVQDVKTNERNGSITIHYDRSEATGIRIIGMLASEGFVPNGQVTQQTSAASGDGDLFAAFSRAVVGAVAQQTVTRSLSTLVTILR
ncbi:MAG: HMA2 domain-containing protein [Wenzhouxiangella sp.]